MIKSFKIVSIPVSDQDRALAFYTEKLGFRVHTDQPFNDKQRWIELSIPGAETLVGLFTPEGHENRIGGFYPATFHCDNIDRTFEELTERGVAVSYTHLDVYKRQRHGRLDSGLPRRRSPTTHSREGDTRIARCAPQTPTREVC